MPNTFSRLDAASLPPQPSSSSTPIEAPRVTWDTAPDSYYQSELARQQQLADQQAYERMRLRQRIAEDEANRSISDARLDDATDRILELQRQQETMSRIRENGKPKEMHPVYLINCKGCGAFLTDRGMKAVLLLRPHVTLFSTDVMPQNCGPLYATQNPSILAKSKGATAERTCECLTQTLGCYGCGSQIGYHIASPCRMCTSSVNHDALKRGSNGHRTVLHCSEIEVRERRYVPGEPGVMSARAATPPLECLSAADSRRGPPPVTHVYTYYYYHGQAIPRHVMREAHPSNSTIPRSPTVEDNLVTLFRRPQESAPLQPLAWDPNGNEYEDKVGGQGSGDSSLSLPPMHQTAPGGASRPRRGGADDKSTTLRRIEKGGLVYWSDLVAGGERPEPFDPDLVLSMPTAGR
ncbi:hypothetical protein BDZ90DRAFT_153092 [Jaminaea rosea]|uniref:Uncharacterized protein n=1 Tax=Jaminaea rosea TaxID=1569628 RepID=A0A316UTM8_9BASI|nr:hypothetical protein BDZ90DRAFT_153092 [Jaminaea rosea]PWN28612.1 hypothetical protein BDZ90DRAFT_153092 [Jaminaea rosea]